MPRRRAPIEFEILNEREISAFFVELGRVPQKTVKKAARAGAMVVKRAVLSSSQLPVKYGFLRKSINVFEMGKKKGKRNKSGAAAFDVGSDERFNSIFQKPYLGTPRRGSKSPRSMYYYPASMEFGFANLKGGVGGHHYLKKSGIAAEAAAQDKMIEVLSKDIDAIKTRG